QSAASHRTRSPDRSRIILRNPQLGQRLRGQRHAVGPVIASSREDTHAVAVATTNEPVAIVLDLERPLRATRHGGAVRREARLDEAEQGGGRGRSVPAHVQIIFETIIAISSAEKARSDSVRILPSEPRLRLRAVAAISSGASVKATISYRPCVQKISFTVTPNVLAICLKASARFGESLAALIP